MTDDDAGTNTPTTRREDLIKAIEDLSREVPGTAAQPILEPYNPDRDRERVRGRIAFALVALIAVLTISSYVMVFFFGRSVDDIAKLNAMIASPLIALTSGIIGFYFGAQTRPS